MTGRVSGAIPPARQTPPASPFAPAGTVPPAGTVLQGGRQKAYRPLPAAEREAALRAGLAAYEAGDFFEAHEWLEPAWMGTADPLERELYQGLIKLAAGFVHAVRGNPVGAAKNLRGARTRLGGVVAGAGPSAGLDLPDLLAQIDALLVRLADGAQAPELTPPILHPAPDRGPRP